MEKISAGIILSAIGYTNIVLILSFILFAVLALSIRKILIFVYALRQHSLFLELTPPAFTEKSAYTTQQLFSVLHNLGSHRSWSDRLLGRKNVFSFEIISTRTQGIRYIACVPPEHADIFIKTLRAYLPQVRVKQITDYTPETVSYSQIKVISLKLKKHFAFPLAKQNMLSQHDPVAYITGMMTTLQENELVSLQIVVSPTVNSQTLQLSHAILRNEDVLQKLTHARTVWYLLLFRLLFQVITITLQEIARIIQEIFFGTPRAGYESSRSALLQEMQRSTHLKPARVLSTFEQELVASIQEKIDQPLYETTIRALVLSNNPKEQKQRLQGILSSLSVFSIPKYQSFSARTQYPFSFYKKFLYFAFRKRLLSLVSNTSRSLLSVSEIAALYHFPFTETTKTENIVKEHSNYLPAPLSLKNGRDLAVVFGKNTYGESTTPIGLTQEERATHMYMIGRTGSGKTTLLYAMAKHDIENGEGLAFIDPHGDVAEDLVASIPNERIDDLMYVNPVDMKYPIGINLLELTPGLDRDEAELEKEVVAEGVISLFRKVFAKDEAANAHRIEYILRNTIYTAFALESPTIFTIYDILNNPPFQKKVVKHLTDENLKNFWRYEFGRAGDYQAVKMVSGVTARIGRFLFSPTAKRILEQKKSSINFDEILTNKKILICNFSQGNLGEDTARLLGTTILTKIQQATLRRARIAKRKRTPFYLYVDEFQNFATSSFIKLLSEGRKYGLAVCIAEQSVSQQDDRNIVNTILANVTTVVCFRSANPVDEQLLLTQFAPYVAKGDIMHLPRYQFYIKIAALTSEEPFSGETIYIPVNKNKEAFTKRIDASRRNYATVYTPHAAQKTIHIEPNEPQAETTASSVSTNSVLPIKRTHTPTARGGNK